MSSEEKGLFAEWSGVRKRGERRSDVCGCGMERVWGGPWLMGAWGSVCVY